VHLDTHDHRAHQGRPAPLPDPQLGGGHEVPLEAILETRPRDVMFDPDALSLRMVKESSPVANLTLCDGVSLEDAVRDGQERGFSFSLGDEA
jgi:hypothetical protein